MVHGYPIKAPMLDIHTVGAGGGSIAFVDTGGLFKVGPRSAGADPGPACYDCGNDEPAAMAFLPSAILGRSSATLLINASISPPWRQCILSFEDDRRH